MNNQESDVIVKPESDRPIIATFENEWGDSYAFGFTVAEARKFADKLIMEVSKITVQKVDEEIS